ncbi:fungal-specific transcription factor domain-containing protein [Nemania sp. FL0916]|nr:fungal-specific transcription factor domain-containing protein [Nemania sp. FL0916]
MPFDREANKAAPGRLVCDICRERKVRCDRALPRCGRCDRLDHDCNYRGRVRHTLSRADLPNQLKALQERLEQTEARLSEQLPQLQLPEFGALGNQNSLSETTPSSIGPIAPNGQALHDPLAAISATALVGLDPANFPPHLPMDTSFDLNPDPLAWLIDNSSTVQERPEAEGSDPNDEFRGLGSTYPPDTLALNDAESRRTSHDPRDLPTDTSPTSLTALFSDNAGENNDELLCTGILLDLHANFFSSLYPTMPIISKDHFVQLVRDHSDGPQVQALIYGLALLGAMVSLDRNKAFEDACLDQARAYIEKCEKDDELMISFELFRALLCIIRYELTHKTIQRAWLTLGRAVRLGNILGLHLKNAETEGSDVHRGLPLAKNFAELEERRRAFWVLYICETYASSRARLPPLLQEDHITIALPAPDTWATDDSVHNDMPTLHNTYDTERIRNCPLSPFAGVVLVCAIARRCQPHAEDVARSARSFTPGGSPKAHSYTLGDSAESSKGFWDRQFSLITLLRHRTELLGPHLTVRSVQTHPVAFALYVYLCGVDVALQETAISQAQKQDFSPVIVADSVERSRAAAYRLVGVAQSMLSLNQNTVDFFSLHGAFMARPLVVAAQVLGRDLVRYQHDIEACSKVVLSLNLLFGALDRAEDKEGFWHKTIQSVVSKLHEWEEAHNDRPADTLGYGYVSRG